MIRELDIVALTCDVPEDGLKRGDTGTVVDVLGDGAAFLVEFMDSDGDTIAVSFSTPLQGHSRLMNPQASDISIRPSRLVYHYTKVETALCNILPSGKIKLGSYLNANDPREAKDWQLGVTYGGPSASEEFMQICQYTWAEMERVQASIRLFCCTMDPGQDPFAESPELRGFGKSRMWAQYASDEDRRLHTGVCLVFDAAALDTCIRKDLPPSTPIWSGPVDYQVLAYLDDHAAMSIDGNQAESAGTETALRMHVESNMQHLLFTKSLDWSDEAEFRWVCSAPAEKEDIYIQIGDALVGVIAGLDFPQGAIPTLVGFCSRANVLLCKMHWFQGQWRRPSVLGNSSIQDLESTLGFPPGT